MFNKNLSLSLCIYMLYQKVGHLPDDFNSTLSPDQPFLNHVDCDSSCRLLVENLAKNHISHKQIKI